MESSLQNTEWDDQRRFEMLKSILPNKKILDFGCGNGGFILRGKELAAEIVGLEVEKRVQDYWSGRMNVVPDLESAGGGYDLITAFHVVEHLPDPRKVLWEMSEHLNDNGMIINKPVVSFRGIPISREEAKDFIIDLEDEISDICKTFSISNPRQENNLIETLKSNCRKVFKEKTGKKPYTNVNLIKV